MVNTSTGGNRVTPPIDWERLKAWIELERMEQRLRSLQVFPKSRRIPLPRVAHKVLRGTIEGLEQVWASDPAFRAECQCLYDLMGREETEGVVLERPSNTYIITFFSFFGIFLLHAVSPLLFWAAFAAWVVVMAYLAGKYVREGSRAWEDLVAPYRDLEREWDLKS